MKTRNNDEYSMILLKPDAYIRNLTGAILQEFRRAGLKIIYTKKIQLTEEMLRGYQPLLNEPDDNGETAWQFDIIKAYTQMPTDIYLFYGNDAIRKTNEIKQRLRDQYIKGENKCIIYNLLHAADDPADLKLNVSILIPEKLNLIEKED